MNATYLCLPIFLHNESKDARLDALYMFGRMWVHTLLLLMGNLQQWAALEVSLKPVYHMTLLIWIACLWFEEPEVTVTPEMQRAMRPEHA